MSRHSDAETARRSAIAETDLRVLRVPRLFRHPVIAIPRDLVYRAAWCGRSRASMYQTLRHRLGRFVVYLARHDMTSAADLGGAHTRRVGSARTASRFVASVVVIRVARISDRRRRSRRCPRSAPASASRRRSVPLLSRAVANDVHRRLRDLLRSRRIGHRGVLFGMAARARGRVGGAQRRARGGADARREAAGDSARAPALARRHRRDRYAATRSSPSGSSRASPTICAWRWSAPTNAALRPSASAHSNPRSPRCARAAPIHSISP